MRVQPIQSYRVVGGRERECRAGIASQGGAPQKRPRCLNIAAQKHFLGALHDIGGLLARRAGGLAGASRGLLGSRNFVRYSRRCASPRALFGDSSAAHPFKTQGPVIDCYGLHGIEPNGEIHSSGEARGGLDHGGP